MSKITDHLYFASPAWLQNLLISGYGYNLYRKRYTGIYHSSLEKIEESLHWSQEKSRHYQGEQLHNIVKHCRQHILYYQKVFAEYGLHENDITSPADITKLPILSKQTLREQGHLFRLPGTKPYMVQHTSGSTGTPLSLWVNEYTYKLAMALLVNHEENHGVPFGGRRATFAGRMLKRADDLKPPFSRYNRAENQQLFSSYHLNSSTFPHYRAELNRFQPEEIIGYPSAICDLATQYLQTDCKPEFALKAIITNSETLLAWQRERIESVFNCRVFDYYGTAEYVLFAGQGTDGLYHLNPIIGITEVICDNPQEKTGRLTATTLTNKLMPLLRYDLGDTAEKSSLSEETTVHELRAINGRVDDYIETPDGRKIGRIDHIFKGLKGIQEAQVVQNTLNHCTINLVASASTPTMNQTTLKNNFNSRTGGNIELTINFVSHIHRGANGKFKSVIGLDK